MGKPSVSIGDDTPTGEPDNGPKGPYITGDDDGSHPIRHRLPPEDAGSEEHRRQVREPSLTRTETQITRESELASDNASEAPPRGTQPDMPDALAKRPKGPAQP